MIFAVYEVGGPIWGIGHTKLEAYKDAATYCDSPLCPINEMEQNPDNVVGSLKIGRTDSLTANCVKRNGGNIPYEVENGLVSIMHPKPFVTKMERQ